MNEKHTKTSIDKNNKLCYNHFMIRNDFLSSFPFQNLKFSLGSRTGFFPEGDNMKIKIKDTAFEFVSMSVMMVFILATVVAVLTVI